MADAFDRQAAISRLELTRWLLRAAGLFEAADMLRDEQAVFPLDDGQMGSFTLDPSSSDEQPAAEAKFKDDDGVEVLVTLFVDADGQPVSVDFWKVDFEPILSFPSQNQLSSVRAIS